MGFKERYERTLEQAAQCACAAGRDPQEIKVVAVSKTVDIDVIQDAYASGARDFGENRPDALAEKCVRLSQATWHFIGNIQSRKIADIVRDASLVHSLWQEHHLHTFEQAAAALGKVQDVLLEVNISGEQSKSGLEPAQVKQMLAACAEYPHICVRGLMTMAPQGDRQVARECFEELARLRDELRAGLAPDRALKFNDLSMGMSEDWREAIAAGATIVRIGRALFDDSFEDSANEDPS